MKQIEIKMDLLMKKNFIELLKSDVFKFESLYLDNIPKFNIKLTLFQ